MKRRPRHALAKTLSKRDWRDYALALALVVTLCAQAGMGAWLLKSLRWEQAKVHRAIELIAESRQRCVL